MSRSPRIGLIPYEAALQAELSEIDLTSGYANGDSAQFERIANYEPVFNRMLIYRGKSLHSASIGPAFAFDADPRTGRLT